VVGSCEQGNEPSGLIKGGRISWRTERLSASQELCSMKLLQLCFLSIDTFVNRLLYDVFWRLTHTHTHTHTDCVSKSFRTESITKYTLTTINTRREATQRVVAAKLTRLIHKIAIQLHLVLESCTICSSRSRRPVRKLLGTPSRARARVCVHTHTHTRPVPIYLLAFINLFI
jgi:hypothetical protein